MRVALDATPLALSSGGLLRYVEELSAALATAFSDDQFFPVAGDRGRGPLSTLSRRWWTFGLARELARLRADLFHGTNFEVPYLPLRPSVLTLHDLSPWTDPGWHHAADRVRQRTPPLIRLGLATMVITPSEAVRRQAIDYFRMHPSRVLAVPLAAARHFRLLELPPVERPYFLYVGVLEPRKNLPLLLTAWRALRQAVPVDLVLAGRRRADFPPLKEEPGLRVLGEVAEAELVQLYSGALALVYPSLYEGFGLPVLEAMQCGCPVITSRDPAITETAGGAAVQLDARDARVWVEAMRVAAATAQWRAAWREKALRRAAEFSWERTARLTREVYEEAQRRF